MRPTHRPRPGPHTPTQPDPVPDAHTHATPPLPTLRADPNGGGGGNNNGGGGGGGSPVGWILVGLVGLALVVLAVGAVAFWFFKLREPSAPSTASGLAESFAPSINLSKA